MIRQWLGLPVLAFCLALGQAIPVGAETLTVAGTGSSAPLVQLLFDEFRKQAPEAALNQITPPLGSGGSLRALAAGRIDMAFSGRPLKPEEQARVGRKFDLAHTPLVFATSGGKRNNGFTLEEMAEVYEGRLKQWDSGQPIRLVLRASFESDTLMLRAMSPAMDKAVVQAAQRPGMVIGNNDLETLDLIVRTPGALGPITLGLLATTGTRLNVFPLNGVMPSLATLRSGVYPWIKTISAVLPQQPSPMAVKFAAFLQSDKAHALMLRYDYLPENPK